VQRFVAGSAQREMSDNVAGNVVLLEDGPVDIVTSTGR
jgi:hypothetical protein